MFQSSFTGITSEERLQLYAIIAAQKSDKKKKVLQNAMDDILQVVSDVAASDATSVLHFLPNILPVCPPNLTVIVSFTEFQLLTCFDFVIKMSQKLKGCCRVKLSCIFLRSLVLKMLLFHLGEKF